MSSFRWRDTNGHDDADAADDRLIEQASQPLGQPTSGWRNAVAQADQRADAQRRRAARLEARLQQVERDLAWIVILVGIIGFVLGFVGAATIGGRPGG